MSQNPPTDTALATSRGFHGGDNPDLDLLWDSDGFAHVQRVAKLFAESSIIPEHLRGKVADVTIALTMARRMKEDPLVVMQNMTSIKGKAGWQAQYVIARANRLWAKIDWRIEKRPEPIRFKRSVKIDGSWKIVDVTMPDMTLTAYATDPVTKQEVSFAVDSAMAIADGWAENPKYSSLAQLMLSYRSAVLLVRLHAPEIMLGIPTVEEIIDVDYATVTTATADGGEVATPRRRGPGRKNALGVPDPEPKQLTPPIDVASAPKAAEPAPVVVEPAPKAEAPAPKPTLVPPLPPTPPDRSPSSFDAPDAPETDDSVPG